jgi:hypothetical protein
MALEALHHGRAFGGFDGGSFTGIHGQNDGVGPHALSHTDADAVEPGDLGEAGNACGVEMRAHTIQSFFWRAGALGSFEPDFLC